MKDKLSKRDWETISAYLDGQLSERKQARLASRLEQDQQLRVALDELRNTRQVLRNSPRLRAPRSFMLTPETAGQPIRMPRLAPVFGWASAVASFLFVLFLVGDLFSAGGAIPMALNNIPTQEEFVAPRSQVAEDEVIAQPASNAGGMEEPSSLSSEDAAQPEIPEGDAAPEVAAASEIESAPKEELTPISKAIDMVAAEETTSEEVGTAPEGESTDETVDAGVMYSAESESVEVDSEESEKEADVPEENADVSVGVASVTDTLAIESTPEQHLLAPPVEVPQPAEEAHPTEEAQPQTEEMAQPPAARTLPTETRSEATPTLVEEPINTEIPLEGGPPVEKQDDFLIGTEVILGLIALGAGLAWVYLRRRGG